LESGITEPLLKISTVLTKILLDSMVILRFDSFRRETAERLG